jgi:3-methyladenine DNA glycosylase/8-oxoguanine DNA glycosylase
LCREEKALRGIVVEGAVERLVGRRVGLVRRVLEEEDDAVNRVEGGEAFRLECQELFELDIFDTEIVKQIGEDTLNDQVRFAQTWLATWL